MYFQEVVALYLIFMKTMVVRVMDGSSSTRSIRNNHEVTHIAVHFKKVDISECYSRNLVQVLQAKSVLFA